MSQAVDMVEIWRGDLLESLHQGQAVVVDDTGQVAEAWGDANALIYPRSSCKMVQALPLIESGAAEALGLTDAHLALACASHNAADVHLNAVGAWMSDLGLHDSDFRCGPQKSRDPQVRTRMTVAGEAPCQIHNNCSGKHAGFLTVSKHLGGDAEYLEIDHPVQRAVKQAFEEVTGEDSPLWAIDGCSAPNHACTVTGLARAMARFATASETDARGSAMVRLRTAMMTHPVLVAGEGRACTGLMRACEGRAAIKTGAEGVFIAILPEKRMGVALKIADGTTRASECAMAALLVRLGVVDARHPLVAPYFNPDITNWRGLVTGHMRPAATLA